MERWNEVVYTGNRTTRGCQISRTDPNGEATRIKLSDSLKLWKHSPSGLEWGYGGSGPAQTALALLLDWTGDAQVANQLHQAFKFLIVAGLPSGAMFSVSMADLDAENWALAAQTAGETPGDHSF